MSTLPPSLARLTGSKCRPPRTLPAFLLAALLMVGCREVASLRDRGGPASPHEAYARALQSAGLHETALGQQWLASGERALRQPHVVTLPHREAVFLPPDEPAATGFGFRLREGERLRVTVERDAHWQGQLFLDLLVVPQDTGQAARRLASADSTPVGLTWIARQDGMYLVRMQPELLRGGRSTITIQTEPSLAFPVSGRGSRAIGSMFGAPRDGGAREHHGIDIFAPRGTPVVAAAAGTVRRVETTGIGGRVVWLSSDEQRLSLYYAHLDSQRVEPGARVQPGDTLGTVGNTGNARGTPPHLHFGIYRRGRGPVDPYPFVHTPRADPPDVRADVTSLGAWLRTAASTRLRAAPTEQASGGRSVARYTPAQPLGGSGGWYRVRLPDGAEGYLPARGMEPATRPIRRLRLADGGLVLWRPQDQSPAVDSVPAGTEIPALGQFEDFAFVRTPAGRIGWILRPE
jgi:murein DD-endopeptidase MepM/ murein hydrolase activator NlpD